MAEPSHASMVTSAIDATKTAIQTMEEVLHQVFFTRAHCNHYIKGKEGLKFQESVNIFVKSLEQLLQPDHAQGLKLTPTQSKQLFSTVLPLLLHPAHQVSINGPNNNNHSIHAADFSLATAFARSLIL